MNYKKLKNGFSMAELIVALSIFAIISTMGVGALSYILRTQYRNQLDLENTVLREARTSTCLKKIYYSPCMQANVPNCTNDVQQSIADCHNSN